MQNVNPIPKTIVVINILVVIKCDEMTWIDIFMYELFWIHSLDHRTPDE